MALLASGDKSFLPEAVLDHSLQHPLKLPKLWRLSQSQDLNPKDYCFLLSISLGLSVHICPSEFISESTRSSTVIEMQSRGAWKDKPSD